MKKFFVSALILALNFGAHAASAEVFSKYYFCENPSAHDFYFKMFQVDPSKGILRAGVSYGQSGREFSDSFILDGAQFGSSSDELKFTSSTKGPSYNQSEGTSPHIDQHVYETTLQIKNGKIMGHIKLKVAGQFPKVMIDEDISCESSEKPMYESKHYFYDCGPNTWLRMQQNVGFGDKHFFVVNSKVFRVDRFSISGRPVFNSNAGFLNMESPYDDAERGTFFIPIADLSNNRSKVRLTSYRDRVVVTGDEPHDSYSCNLTIL